jgi:hypothetical protein
MSKTPTHTDWNKFDFNGQFLPGLSIDTVIFGFHDSQLMVLLLQYKNTNAFALPGGFIRKKDSGDEAAQRVLKDRTGLTIYTWNNFTRLQSQIAAILPFSEKL